MEFRWLFDAPMVSQYGKSLFSIVNCCEGFAWFHCQWYREFSEEKRECKITAM